MDIPYMACRIATGEKVQPDFRCQVGLRYRWLVPHELAHLAMRPDRLRGVADFFDFGPHRRCEIKLSDPLPLLAETVRSAVRFL